MATRKAGAATLALSLACMSGLATWAEVPPDVKGTADSSYTAKDVEAYDLYRGEGHLIPDRNENVRSVSGALFYETDKYNLCGMHLVAKTSEAGGAKLGWELKVSVLRQGDNRVASIAAGSFSLPQNAKKAVPRPPINRLVIQLKGEKESAEARIYGKLSGDYGVIGEFPEAYAEKLFAAFDAGTPFTLDVTYDSGEHETVRAHTRGGAVGGNFFFHGSDAPMRRCLRSLVPASKEGLQNRMIELPHPG
ncbi:MAG: hypothetical protein ACLPTM_09280 [Steroidobacteraceae bacterium]